MNTKEMRELIYTLNKASEAYYNSGNPLMADKDFDMLLEKLRELEEKTGVVFSDSPTVNVGAKVLSELKEVTHTHDMLSLAKCHSAKEVIDFAKGQPMVAMTKADGLTVTLRYEDGKLASAQTRGNGKTGTDCTEHAKLFTNIPLTIPYLDTIEIDGEAIIKYDDFAEVNKNGEFKNPRNLAAGTLNTLDTSLVKERRLSFVAWDLITDIPDDNLMFTLKYHSNRLMFCEDLGFETIEYITVDSYDNDYIDKVNNKIKEVKNIPSDGVVWKFNDINYGRKQGKTSHHFNNAIAFKFADEDVETTFRRIEWNPYNKTGVVSPVAVFDTVEIDGTEVSNASVHNISILEELDLCEGDIITVYKANMIIPQIRENLSSLEREEQMEKYGRDKHIGYTEIPSICPACGGELHIVKNNDTKVLMCNNPDCKGKLLGKLTQFVCKDAMDIDGLSSQTLQILMNRGLVNTYRDLYYLFTHRKELESLPGFGKRKVEKLLSSIEKSRETKLSNFLVSLSIPNIGRHASKDIEKLVYKIKGDEDPFLYLILSYKDIHFENIDGFGDVMINSLINYIKENKEMMYNLWLELMLPDDVESDASSNKLEGLTFVVTGKVNIFKNRNELSAEIQKLGGKVAGSVSKNTSYLVNNDSESESSKNLKAKKLGVKIITEQELLDIINA